MRPAGPTNGWPSRSSRSPGCSPTSMTWDFASPSPKTVCEAFSHSGQAWQPAAASRSFGRVGRSGTSGAAVSVAEDAMPAAYPGPAGVKPRSAGGALLDLAHDLPAGLDGTEEAGGRAVLEVVVVVVVL